MAQRSVATGPRWCTHCRATFKASFERCPNDGAPLAVLDHDPLEGATLGPYALADRIGEGAMGRIYRARHARLPGREVALKVLFGDVAAVAGMPQRFAHEAEATSRLAHPNIVSVLDVGDTPEGLLYLAMELVEGRPLSELIAEGPLPWPRAVAIARQLCVALAHAHSHGIVHRDLKPDNVLVAAGDHVRIVDFGLALDVDPVLDRTRLTSGGMVVGTPAYAAPEQQLGNGVVDGRADLFSVGVTLFELLAGNPPFDGTAMEVICQNAMADRPTLASRGAPAVPPALEAIVETLMRPEPSQRFASAGDVIAALDALVASPPRRRGWIIAATAAPLIALGIGVIAWPHGSDRDVAAPRIATAAKAVEAPLPGTVTDARSPQVDVPTNKHVDASMSPRVDVPVKHAIRAGTQTHRTDPPMATRIDAPMSTEVDPKSKRIEQPMSTRIGAPMSPRVDSPSARSDAPMSAHVDASSAPMSPRIDAPAKRADAGKHTDPPMAPRATPPHDDKGGVRVAITHLDVRGALPATAVARALERITGDLQACYRAAATPSATTVAVRLVIDASGHATDVDARGDGLVAACVGAVLGNLQSTAGNGAVAVTFDVGFATAAGRTAAGT